MKKQLFQPANFFLLLLPLAVFRVSDHVFFWDTIQLGSKQAHWFYETQFTNLILPEMIDSGHPPLFGLYLAACWTLFGKSLLVSHLAMIPFLIGIVLFLQRIGNYLGNGGTTFFLLCLFFADPVILSQSLLISPDIVLMFFFLMALWSLFYNQRLYLYFAAVGLAMISMRGMMVVLMLYIFDLIRPFLKSDKSDFSSGNIVKAAFFKLPPYVPSGLLALAFLVYHYQQTGWIGYHENSPWAASFEKIDGFGGLVKNIAVLAWRYLDFGRIFLWLVLAYGLWVAWKRKMTSNYIFRQLLVLFILAVVVLSPSQLAHKYLVVHRYNIPGFIALTFLAYHVFFNLLAVQQRLAQNLFTIAFIGLISGNLWVYPKKISQGWDSTLAHMPYYDLRGQMLDFIDQQGLEVDRIGTAFPELDAFKYRDLSDSESEFSRKNLETQEYILYSNVMNDFTDEEIDELEQEWIVIQAYEKMNICVILYQRE